MNKIIKENTLNKFIEILKIINEGNFYEFKNGTKIGLNKDFNIGCVFTKHTINKEYVSNMVSFKISDILKLIEED